MITLAQLEEEVARRTGPFFKAAQDAGSPTSSTTLACYMPALKSSSLLGGPENLFLVRRGEPYVTPTFRGMWNDLATYAPHESVDYLDVRYYTRTSIPIMQPPPPSDGRWQLYVGPYFAFTVAAQDRIRQVQTFDSTAGRIVVDRNWSQPMQPTEVAIFTHLHPEQELRVAVLGGLRRCFLEELIAGSGANAYGYSDLTSAYPWLTNPDQVVRVQPMGSGTDSPFEAVVSSGHVMLKAPMGQMWVTCLRPAWSWVNEAESSGPTLDGDQLSVDLDYAASAGHIEAWHQFPAHMFSAAAGNLQATQEMAAREFTRQSMIWGPPPLRSIQFSDRVGQPMFSSAAL